MWPIVFAMIALHGLDGREVDINAEEITSMHCRVPGKDNLLFAEGVNTVIHLTDGKFISVKETCGEIRDMVQGDKK